MKNGHCNSCGKFPKRRRVSAVRDFPPGCGPFASIILRPVEEIACVGSAADNPVGREKGADVIGNDSARTNEAKLEPDLGLPQSFDPIALNGQSNDKLEVESLAKPCIQIKKIESVYVEPVPLLDGMETLSEGVLEPVKSVKHEAVDVSIHLYGMDIASLVKTMVQKKEYPPRRKISAVRDFPCGRNAPTLFKEECTKVFSPLQDTNLEQMNICIEENPMKEMVKTDVNQMGDDFQDRDAPKKKLERSADDEVRIDAESPAYEQTNSCSDFGTVDQNEMKLGQDSVQERSIRFHENTENQPNQKLEMGPFDDIGSSEENLEKSLAVYKEDKISEGNCSSVDINREVVMGLMAMEKSPWRHEQGKLKQLKSALRRKNKEENYEGTGSCIKKNSSVFKKSSQDMDQMIAVDEEDHSCSNVDENVLNTVREKVKETLGLFRTTFMELLKEGSVRRIDLQAAKVLKEKGKYVNVGKQIIGSVPGVEVGDKFHYWVELNIVGLHRQSQSGIDYVKQDQNIYATSIVASGGYDDNAVDSNVLVYTGSGGNMMNANKEPEDQKLERGNLALKNSVDKQNPVRVIRGLSNASDARARTYIYDGQYLVSKYWQEKGSHGKLVYKFGLVRIPGQP